MINYLIENGALNPIRKDRSGEEHKFPKESHVIWRIGPGPCILAECPRTHRKTKFIERISERSKFWHCGTYETIPGDLYADYLETRGNHKGPPSKEDEKYKVTYT